MMTNTRNHYKEVRTKAIEIACKVSFQDALDFIYSEVGAGGYNNPPFFF